MFMKPDYERTIKLQHNEVAAKVNLETGLVSHLPKRPNNIPAGSEIFESKALFRKDYTNSWNFLRKMLKPIEFKAAYSLALMAKANTNSLEPLNDDTTVAELMEILDVSKNVVTPIMKKLFNLGVYAKFEVRDYSKPYTKYWIFNPYLSFNGRIIKSDIANLFSGTECAKAFNDPNFVCTKNLNI